MFYSRVVDRAGLATVGTAGLVTIGTMVLYARDSIGYRATMQV